MPFIGTRWKTLSLNGVLVDEEVVITTEPIVVHCIVLWYNGAGRRRFDLLDNDDNRLLDLEFEPLETTVISTRWEADNGLKIIPRHTDATLSYFSILYSNHGNV